MRNTKIGPLLGKWYSSAGSFVRRILAFLYRFSGVVFGFFGKFGALPMRWFVVLNCVYILVTIFAVSMIPGGSRFEATQANSYFRNFYGNEIQRDVDGTFLRNFRWSAQEGVLYLIRQPNDTGFTIISLLATTVIDNQSVELAVNQQRVAQFAVQPKLFRTYQTLVRMQWEPFRFWHEIDLKSSESIDVADRSIALAVGDVVLTPLPGTKYPHGMVIIYLFMVVVISTWVYVTFSPKVSNAVYFVLVALLVGFWFVMSNWQLAVNGLWQLQIGLTDIWKSAVDGLWQLQTDFADSWQKGTQRFLLLMGNDNTHIVWFVFGTVLNVLLVFNMYRYRTKIQNFISNCREEITHRFEFLHQYIAPLQVRVRWLWQRPVLLYSMTIVLYFGGWLWNTQVLSPIDTKFAVNIPFTKTDYINSTGFFSDYVTYVVPEQYLIVNEPRSTWISTWSNKIELGREIRHWGLGQTYVLNWGMQFLISDPNVYFTVSFVFYVFLSGLFALLYVRRLLQHAGLALLAAYMITFSPFFFFWNTYMVFYTATTWGLALLYGLQRLRDTRDWKSVLFLIFAVYSLFSLAYPQYISYLAYMLLGYFVHIFWQMRNENDIKWKFLGYSVLAVGIGASMSTPLYVDLLQIVSLTDLSVRNLDYFLLFFPKLGNVSRIYEIGLAYVLRDVFEPLNRFLSTLYHYRGGNTTLFVFLLMLIGSIWRWRETWGWSLWTVFAVVLSFSQTAFVFSYEQLHLPQFSRGLALFSGPTQHIPQMILAVYGMQVVIRESFNKSVKILFGMFALGMQLIVAAIALRITPTGTFAGMQSYVAFELIIMMCVLLLALVRAPGIKWAVVFGVLCMQTIVLIQPLLVTTPIQNVHTTSPTTELIRKTLQPGERMAMVDERKSIFTQYFRKFSMVEPLGGNYNVLSEVANIGTYNPLQSRYYVTLMKRLGNKYDGAVSQNMYVRTIQLPMPANDQWMANIRTVVSKNPQYSPNLALAFRTEGQIPFYVYTTPTTMGCCLQVPLTNVRTVESDQRTDYWVDAPKAATNRQLLQRENQGDRFVVPVTESTTESIIVFSQIYHPQWYARVRTAAGWEEAATVVINEAYQGVRVPVGTQEVVMEFRPWIYWGIIPNVFWLGCGVFLVGRWLWRYEPLHSWVRHMRKGMA